MFLGPFGGRIGAALLETLVFVTSWKTLAILGSFFNGVYILADLTFANMIFFFQLLEGNMWPLIIKFIKYSVLLHYSDSVMEM